MSKQSEMVMLIMSMGISENIQDVIGDKLQSVSDKELLCSRIIDILKFGGKENTIIQKISEIKDR